MDGDRVVTEWDAPVEMKTGDTIKIPEGIAHFFINHSMDETANVQFIIPNTHFLAAETGTLDKKLNTRPTTA